MSADRKITRRHFAGAAALLALAGKARAQGFAGLEEKANGFAAVVPGRAFAQRGVHPWRTSASWKVVRRPE